MYNSFSGRKNRIFEEKKNFQIFWFLHRRVPLDIFGDLRYFQKKFENLKNSFSRTSLTWNGTKSWILVTLAHLAWKWQTGLWHPGQICPPPVSNRVNKIALVQFQCSRTVYTSKVFPKPPCLIAKIKLGVSVHWATVQGV